MEPLPTVIVAVLTLVSPLLTALFTKVSMSPKVKNAVAVVVSALIAGAYVYMTGGFEGVESFAVPLGVVYGLQQVIYNQFLRKTVAKVEADIGPVKDNYEPKHRAE